MTNDRFGGSGTTANTFLYILWGCLRDPGVVRKLKQELKSAFPDQSVLPDNVVCAPDNIGFKQWYPIRRANFCVPTDLQQSPLPPRRD